MAKRVHIIDCGLGNIMSVRNAFEKIGCETVVAVDPVLLKSAEHIVLPGVGAFGTGMERLRASGFDKILVQVVSAGAKLLGICLGMQLLFDKSSEFGEHEGLHILPGDVKQIDPGDDLRIPHIGWNDTFFLRPDEPLVRGLENPSCFYYVNSYACVPADRGHIIGTYRYGSDYAGIVRHNNSFGVQFHPEKSQSSGLRLLDNFLSA
jgi:imidazole glycerol-phosphate synthase subunit HisH